MQDRNYVQPIVAEAVHIDTVRLSHTYRLSELPSLETLRKLNFDMNFKTRRGGRTCAAHSKPFGRREGDPHITIILSENVSSYSGMIIECSLAKLVNGTGLGKQTDEDIACGLDAIEDCIRILIGFDFDARTARVRRFDVNADFRVGGGRILLFEKALSRPHSSLTPSNIAGTTVNFYNKSRAFAIYDKKKEMERRFKEGRVSLEDVSAAEGLLRIESRLQTPAAISRFAKKLSLKNIANDLMTTDVALAFISEGVTQLSLDKPKFSTEARSSMLIEEFGKDAAEMLGTLMYKELLGEDFWKDLGWSKSTYNRKKRELVAANLWNISPYEALPALVVLPDDNNSTSLSNLTPLETASPVVKDSSQRGGFLKRIGGGS
jgi:hypothetical protein